VSDDKADPFTAIRFIGEVKYEKVLIETFHKYLCFLTWYTRACPSAFITDSQSVSKSVKNVRHGARESEKVWHTALHMHVSIHSLLFLNVSRVRTAPKSTKHSTGSPSIHPPRGKKIG